jgi:prolyl-tRNA synthetase
VDALPRKADDFGAWYSAIVVKSELISYYDISGIYVLRPGAFALWEAIQRWFDDKIKSIGVENCLFPLFITKEALQKEEDHVEVWSTPLADHAHAFFHAISCTHAIALKCIALHCMVKCALLHRGAMRSG